MTGPTHQLTGIALALAVAHVAHPPLPHGAVLVASAWLCSGNIRLRRRGHRPLRIGLSPDIDCHLPIEHRTVTHWPLLAILLAAVVGAAVHFAAAAFAPWVAAGVAIGWLGHDLADAMTPHGIPAWGPFSARCVHLLPRGRRIHTGGLAEALLSLIVAAGLVVFITQHFV